MNKELTVIRLDSCWCGFAEKRITEQRGPEDYIKGHIEKYHHSTLIEGSDCLFERELCRLTHKYRLTTFERVQ